MLSDEKLFAAYYSRIENDDQDPILGLRAVAEAAVKDERDGKWISVSDRLPELIDEGTFWCSEQVLTIDLEGYRRLDGLYADKGRLPCPRWKRHKPAYAGEEITHWMPLPEPPIRARGEKTL